MYDIKVNMTSSQHEKATISRNVSAVIIFILCQVSVNFSGKEVLLMKNTTLHFGSMLCFTYFLLE